MNKKWVLALALLCIVVFVIVLAVKEPDKSSKSAKSGTLSLQNARLTVKVLDIGQGDAILIKADGQTVLVDTGDVGTRDKLIALLKKENLTTIDKVIITHPHADHLGGMPEVMENFKIGRIYDSGKTANTVLYKKYLTGVSKKQIPFEAATPGSEIAISKDIKLKILAPDKSLLKDSDTNNSSMVAKLVYDQFSMMLTGDAEKESEAIMVRKFGKDLKSHVLKAAHHGSNSSSSPEFLRAVAPEAVVISLAANNDFHHPHPSTIEKYKKANMKIFRTDTDGTVQITSDGKTYTVAKSK
ncbi:MAG: ComEC/Rec2 family competence protein [Negativicutes bacterium]